MKNRKLNLLMDFYELTMANGYFVDNKQEQMAVFDVFFRSVPDKGGYAVFAGLEQVIDFITNLSFTKEEINYLKSKNLFNEGFIKYLENFKFTSDLYAVKEGTVIFPHEPIMIVKGPIIECQLIETMILLTINHQSLIATKASRIVLAAEDRLVLEFGARRAHGYDAAVYGARAAYIAGVLGSSNTYADFLYQIPALGTMAHSYVQSYKTEYDAFLAYANTYPGETVLLVDTYNTLKEGIPNAIKIHKEVLEPKGHYLKGIRLDSGDLAYLTREARKMLDDAGMHKTQITVSNSLDEYIIKELLHQDAKIDVFGVGERLVTAKSDAVFGGVFKLVAVKENGELVSKIKISDNIQKQTIPGFKQIHRFYKNGKAEADVLSLFDEEINEKEPFLLFDPNFPYRKKWIKDFEVKKMLNKIFDKGKLVYKIPTLEEIRKYHREEIKTLWPEVLRLEKPHLYYVDFTQKLWDLREKLIKEHRNNG